MQINRLFEIVYILLENKIVKAGELAEHFEDTRCDRAGYDGHHRIAGGDYKKPALFLLGRWRR